MLCYSIYSKSNTNKSYIIIHDLPYFYTKTLKAAKIIC